MYNHIASRQMGFYIATAFSRKESFRSISNDRNLQFCDCGFRTYVVTWRRELTEIWVNSMIEQSFSFIFFYKALKCLYYKKGLWQFENYLYAKLFLSTGFDPFKHIFKILIDYLITVSNSKTTVVFTGETVHPTTNHYVRNLTV